MVVAIELLFVRGETIGLLSKRIFSVWGQQKYCHKICFINWEARIWLNMHIEIKIEKI